MTIIATTDTATLPAPIEATIKSRMRDMRMMPAVATQALEVSKDPDCTIKDFCSVVERDAKLATDVLCIANSAMYSAGAPVVSLTQAVTRLGFKQCRNLIMSSGTAALMKKIDISEAVTREALCRHGFLTAFIAVQLNRQLKLGLQGEEFTAGLIHDFGRMVMAVCFADEFRQADDLSFDEAAPEFLQRQHDVLGVDHCQVGAWFAKNSRLPEELRAVIADHHTLQLESGNSKLTALIAAADHMANHVQRVGTAVGYISEDNEALRRMESLGLAATSALTNDQLQELMESTVSEANAMAVA